MRHLILTFIFTIFTILARGGDIEVKHAMHKATAYMMDVASYNGGFVWNYLPDYSRQWGELEARRTMVWLQSPSTPDVGEVLLDAYHATGDEFYYENAVCVARCIMQGQLPCGGWNYMFDLEPEDSLLQWYNTVGRQAWRLEEFQHYYGNATFDDGVTKHCAEFILRLYLEKHDDAFLPSLKKAIDFVLESQYANGGWPQRFPIMNDHPFKGKADYSPFVTLNDNVMVDNIDFLMQCYTSLGMEKLKEPILKAMNLLHDLQQPKPLAGWADQYTPDDLKPAHARSYEPRSVNTGTTMNMILKMMEFYKLTGDSRYLDGVKDAIDFLESLKLPDELVAKVRKMPLQEGEILVPRFINPDNGRPLYVHRKGGNVANGNYYTDENPEGTIAHFSSFATVNPNRLRDALQQCKRLFHADLVRNSPLAAAAKSGPKEYFYDFSNRAGARLPELDADDIASKLNDEGYWPSTLRQVSNSFKPVPQTMNMESEDDAYAQTMAGDEYDTSPYENRNVKGISTRTYIHNMVAMINSLKPRETTMSGLDPQRFVSKVEGKPTALYVLRNSGMEACITNYGARMVSLMVPNNKGQLEDVVLGFDNIDDYHLRKQNFGSVVGRYVGRIKNASFTLDGVSYDLQKTGSNHISHGGYPGFADKVWEVEEKSDSTLCLKYVSPDGENGFPGTLTVKVTYTLANNAVTMDFQAVTDKPTVLNLSNHHFFNISGDLSSSVLKQQLFIDGKYIATYDKMKNLDGKFMRVKNTPFDFTSPKAIGTDIEIYDEQMSITKGYDHSFVLRHSRDKKRPAATLYDEASGRMLEVFTTEPVLHLYTANGLNGSMVGKGGLAYQKQTALCLETMHLADSPNQSEFPPTVLRPGETYKSQTVFHFVEKSPKKRNLLGSILMYGGAASLTGLGIVGLFSLVK